MVNPNGSLDIYIQHDELQEKNQIGCLHPMEIFLSSLECNLPGPKVLNGTYQIPQVQKVM